MIKKVGERKKGLKATILEMKKGESIKFPRKRYSSLMTTRSMLRIEEPGRDWQYLVVPDGILVECLK